MRFDSLTLMKGDEGIEPTEKGTHEIRLLATRDGHLKALYLFCI